jgi:acetoin utilization protein AcuB
MVHDNRTTARRAVEKLLEESSICEQWMTTTVYTVAPSDSVVHARKLLMQHRVNQLPVVGSGKLLGIVTDRDLRDAASAAELSTGSTFTRKRNPQALDDITVEAIMTHPVIALSCHSTLVNAARVMREQRIGSVPIANGDALVGIVTRSDILDAFVAYANGKYKRLDTGQEGAP